MNLHDSFFVPKLLIDVLFVHHSIVNWYASTLVSLLLSEFEQSFHSMVATAAAATFVY